MYLTKKFHPRPASLANFWFDDAFVNDIFSPARKQWASTPAANIKETSDNFTIELAVPGYSKEDFQIKQEGKTLVIATEKKEENTESNTQYNRREFHYNAFSRSFQLPESVDKDAIKAGYTNGILSVVLPKKLEVVRDAQRVITIE